MKFIHYFVALVPSLGFSQELFMGASAGAMANSSVTTSDALSIFNNPGTLGFVENDELTTGYRSFFQLEGWKTVYAAANKQIAKGALGIGFSQFGDELYHTTQVAIGFGHQLGIASLGISVRYQQLHILGFGSSTSWPVDVGGKVELSPHFLIASGIKNINQAKLTKETDERYPSLFFVGFSYQPTEFLVISSQIDYSLLTPAIFRAGIAYSIGILTLRAGVKTNPVQLATGIGFEWKRMAMDYAFLPHTSAGGSHFFTLSYQYSK